MARRDVKVAIVGDASGLRRAFDKAERDAQGFAGKMKAVGASVRSSINTWAPVAGAALVAFGAYSLKSASDMQEATAKLEQTFGDSSQFVKDFGADAAEVFGMSQKEYTTLAADIGALVKPLGATEERAAEMSTTMTRLAADLGSFHNTSAEDAIAAIRSGLSGEPEPMKRFGVVLSDAALKAEALEMGLYSGKGTLDAYAKSQAAYNLILDGTIDAQGDFERTQDGMANKTKTTKAKFDDLSTTLGEKLMPIANVALDGLITGLDSLTEWWNTDGEQYFEDFQVGLDMMVDWWETDGEAWLDDFEAGLDDLGTGMDELGPIWEGFVDDFELGLRDLGAGWDIVHEKLVGLHGSFIILWGAVTWMGSTSLKLFEMVHNVVGGVIDFLWGRAEDLLNFVLGIPGKIGDAIPGMGGSKVIPTPFGMLSFDTGGVVPGPNGAPRMAVVHGGETILPTHKQNVSAGGGAQVIKLVVDGRTLAEVAAPHLAQQRRGHHGSRRTA